MSMKVTRDSKDPMPTADNSQRKVGGNTPVTGEDHDASKSEHITGDQRFTLRTGGETQPTRGGFAGNTPVPSGQTEQHDQSKAERISADRRW